MWIFKKSVSSEGTLSFKGRWVETTSELDAALKTTISEERIRIEEVLDYSLLAQNNEGSALSITTIETHAASILGEATAEVAEKKVSRLKDFQNAHFYTIKLTLPGAAIFAVRKADASWRAKKARTAISVVFTENQLGLDTDPGFNVSKFIDFFIVGDEILISNKDNFESVLNFKQAHQNDFTALQAEPEFTPIFSSVQLLIGHIGENKIQLRRASAIRQKGHYKNISFMKNLRSRHSQYGLQLEFDDQGRIVPTPETCKDVMLALLDHRLNSAFSNNIYDVPNTTTIIVYSGFGCALSAPSRGREASPARSPAVFFPKLHKGELLCA